MHSAIAPARSASSPRRKSNCSAISASAMISPTSTKAAAVRSNSSSPGLAVPPLERPTGEMPLYPPFGGGLAPRQTGQDADGAGRSALPQKRPRAAETSCAAATGVKHKRAVDRTAIPFTSDGGHAGPQLWRRTAASAPGMRDHFPGAAEPPVAVVWLDGSAPRRQSRGGDHWGRSVVDGRNDLAVLWDPRRYRDVIPRVSGMSELALDHYQRDSSGTSRRRERVAVGAARTDA